jgi:hypothetical protein
MGRAIVVYKTGLDGLPDKTLLNSGPLHLNLTWGADGMRPPLHPIRPLRAPGVFGAVARALRGAPRARHARVSRGGCLALPGRSTPCVPA